MTKSHAARLGVEQMEDRLVPALDLTGVEWRTIDGTNNNAALPLQGAAETEQIRFGYGQRFPDGFGDAIITPPQRANPRSISNALHTQVGSAPSARQLTDWAFQWGQWITHDMDLTRNGPQWDVLSTGATGDFRIPVLDPGDPIGPNPMPFNRSEFFPGTGVPGSRREAVNSITSYIDASMVYGSDPVRAAALRTFAGGKLLTSAGGLLLPVNTAGLPNADALNKGAALFLAGDVRANEQVNLTVVHTLFVREHNRLADRIALLQPQLNDEQIYQLARRLVGAEMQAITYQEYLPAIFGYDLAPDPEDAVYDPTVDGSVTNSFAHAVFRFGHSQINETTLLVNNLNQTVGTLSVRDAFFNPEFLKTDPANVGRMLKGLSSQVGQEVDLKMVDGIRNNLFGPPGAGGLDLAALDIQRGRDHGLPDYNVLRNAYGAGAVTTFAEISSDPAIQAKLQAVFGNVNNIDAFVGALAEDHLPGASAGPLVHAVVVNQFERLRDGDRFFYTNDPLLQTPEVRAILDINTVTLSKVIKWNTGVVTLQDHVFFEPSVVVVEVPPAGANTTVVAALGVLTVFDTNTGQVHALRPLSTVSQVILVGSDAAPDVFNLFLSAANGGIEGGVLVTGGDSGGDILRLYGGLGNDAIAVTNATFSVGIVDVHGNDTVRTFAGLGGGVNGNAFAASGIEVVRIATLTGTDNIQVAPGLGVDLLIGFWFAPEDDEE